MSLTPSLLHFLKHLVGQGKMRQLRQFWCHPRPQALMAGAVSPDRFLRWQSQFLGWDESHRSRWRVTDLWLIFSQLFFLASCPFYSFVAGSGTQLLRNVFIKTLFYKMMIFVLVLLAVIALFFCIEGTFPLIFLLLWMTWVFFQTLCKVQLFFGWLRILAYTPHYFFEFFKKFFFEFLNNLAQFILSVTLTSVTGTLSPTLDVFAFNASHPESWFYSVPLNNYF